MSSQPPHIDANLQDADDGANLTSTVVEALRQCLTEEQTTDKAPPGFDRALEALSPSDHTSRAFLDAGFGVWYAYFLATERNQYLRSSVIQLSPSNLQRVVTEVSRSNTHDSVKRRIHNIIFRSDRSAKRCKLLRLNNVELPHPLEASSSDTDPRHTQRSRRDCERQSLSQEPSSTDPCHLHFMSAEAISQEDESSEAHSGTGRVEQHTALASQNNTREWIAFDIDSRYQHAWPKAKNLPFVFPHYMCTAITKRADEASVMLSFPLDPTNCQLVFDISANEVQYVAKEVFDVHIRQVSGRRCAVSEKGATMDINGSITLRGGSAVAVDSLFGHMVGEAFRHSPRRLNELSIGAMLSECLSMEIWGGVDHPSRLGLVVDAENLALLYQQLWRV
ncbi:hypothetical protein HIM_11611 [Hirsutella minnesotensis 3608]|uniref:Uncharacterized protein n=1 Tax=Hirsutella minnesotensis 3608 TaxID=1043627 RepID=A0A0F7ZIX1_9HYPO|nr:hypothetical protein HIM_11611 [Hirsutella minnesotensis 3608]